MNARKIYYKTFHEPFYLYSVYENQHRIRHRYVGRTEASSPEDAFKLFAAQRYKVNLSFSEFSTETIERGIYRIAIEGSEYILKRK